MSHHFDYPTDETLDISDAYCFAGPGNLHGPRTVFGMNTSAFGAPTWNTAGYYELSCGRIRCQAISQLTC